MRPGLQPGAKVEFRITVDPSMRPAFDEKVVHNVLSTVSMIYYMEKAGREMIIPFLEEEEEGAGFEIQVKHIGPAVVGQKVLFTAVCTEINVRRVVCEVTAETNIHLVGKGLFTQAIFKKEEMAKRITMLEKKLEQQTD